MSKAIGSILPKTIGSIERALAVNYLNATKALEVYAKQVVTKGDIAEWSDGVHTGFHALVCDVDLRVYPDPDTPIQVIVRVRNIKEDKTVTDFVNIEGSEVFDFRSCFKHIKRVEE